MSGSVIPNVIKNKAKLSYWCVGAALALLTVMYGGFYWNHCIIPLFLLIIAFFISPQKKACTHTIFIAVLVVLGFFSVLFSQGNPHTGMYEFEKFMCFIMAVIIGFSLKDEIKLLKIIFFITTITAVVGILACCNLMNIAEFVFHNGSFLRLQSFFRYANTTCCFLGCGYFAFAEIWLKEKKKWQIYCGSCILTALYFTFSKAGIPIFLLIATFYLFKNKNLSHVFLIQNAIAIILFIAMNYLVPMRMGAGVFLIIITGIIFTGTAKESQGKSFYVWFVFIAFSIVCGITLLILKPDLAQTFTARICYMKDAVPLLTESPFFGCGFGSWRVIQFRAQSFQYSVTHMHNGIMQIFTECGIPFGIIFMYLTLRSAVFSIKKHRFIYFAIIMLILLHSLIDFDLSYGAILLTLGLVTGSSIASDDDEIKKRSVIKTIPTYFLILTVFVTGLYMTAEYFMRSSFEKAYLNKEYKTASIKAETLFNLCPLDAELAFSRAALSQMNNEDEASVTKYLLQAKKLSPNDTEIFKAYLTTVINDSNAVPLCKEYINMAPKQEKTYAVLKEQLNNCIDDGTISEKTYSSAYTFVETRRIEENVIDRNMLLEKIKEK